MAKRPLALITGASAGLGLEFAKQLAAKGIDLVLSARRLDRLEALAETLSAEHKVKVSCFALDLSLPDAVDQLEAAMSAQRWRFDWVVNNAGYGLTGTFSSRTWEEHQAFLRVLLEVPTRLTHLVLPRMQKRGYGRVVNVASLAGLVPSTAGHTLYGAVKSYLVRFSQSLAQELEGSGVNVSALCPGFTYTEFHDVNATRAKVSRLPRFMWQDAETVVRCGIQAVEQGEVICVPGRWNQFVRAVTKALPEQLALRLVKSKSDEFRSVD